MKIAVFDSSSAKWSAGGEYTRTQVNCLVAALREDDGHSVVLVNASGKLPQGVCPRPGLLDCLKALQLPEPSLPRRAAQKVLRTFGVDWSMRGAVLNRWIASAQIDVVFHQRLPNWWHHPQCALCCWIPDFQHRVLPDFCPPSEIKIRDWEVNEFSRRADVVVVSSEDVRRDFASYFPANASKARVYRFPSRYVYAEEMAAPDSAEILDRFGISESFFLVVNQFFSHKNHAVVIDAVAALKRRGENPQVVMIGQPTDYRDFRGEYLSGLMAQIATHRLEGHVKMLGFVDARTRDTLLRSCKAIVQPSLFEGWNTTIEDAKALGKPVIASDLAVHREQLGETGRYFAANRPDSLADALASANTALPAGHDSSAEDAALAAARRNALQSGAELLQMASEAISLHNS